MFRKYGLMLLLAIAACVLQQAIFSRIVIMNCSIDIVFVFLICFSLLMEDVDSVLFALMCGLVRDSFFPYIFGLNTILYLISAYSIAHINKKIYKDTIFIPIMVSFGATVFKGLMYFAYLFISSIRFDFMTHTLNTLIYESIINAIGSIVIFRVTKKIINIKLMQQEWKF